MAYNKNYFDSMQRGEVKILDVPITRIWSAANLHGKKTGQVIISTKASETKTIVYRAR